MYLCAMDRLQRFLDAQDHMYRIAYCEMQKGKKRSHWIWYIFPQLDGLGKSEMSYIYGLTLEEAKLYLRHPILSLRLRNILKVLLTNRDKGICEIMGSELDAKKLQASMTLFDWISHGDIFCEVLDAFFSGNKHKKTLDIINYVQKG